MLSSIFAWVTNGAFWVLYSEKYKRDRAMEKLDQKTTLEEYREVVGWSEKTIKTSIKNNILGVVFWPILALMVGKQVITDMIKDKKEISEGKKMLELKYGDEDRFE